MKTNGLKTADLNKLKIDAKRLKNHVMRPPHVIRATSYEGPGEEPVKSPARRGAPPPLKHLDVDKFAKAVDQALKNSSAGFCMRLQKNGKTIATRKSGFAQTHADECLDWSTDRVMHIASVSKLITAIAMTKCLNVKDISFDEEIIHFLPAYWKKGPNVKKITFRHLMTHKSGFTPDSSSDYETMKAFVEVGVLDNPVPNTPPFTPTNPQGGFHPIFGLGKFFYANMNFGLCRILIPIVSGAVDKDLLLADDAWDLLTIIQYAFSVASKVFGPAGVTKAYLEHPNHSVLAYYFPASGDGWDSGNLETVSGGAGWHLSINDLLKVMGTFRRKGTIMTKSEAQSLLDNSFGIDVIKETDAGTLFEKNGGWRDGPKGLGRLEQCVAYFLPEDMELAVFVNSEVGMLPRKDLQGLITGIYVDNLK